MTGTAKAVDHEAEAKLGSILRKGRLSIGATLKDVADAIGKSYQYVCDVEHGRRGARMDPLVAMMWAQYLGLDPADVFRYIGLNADEIDRLRVQHYLESGVWARKFTLARRTLQRALPEAVKLAVRLPMGHDQDVARAVRDAMREAINALHIPQKE